LPGRYSEDDKRTVGTRVLDRWLGDAMRIINLLVEDGALDIKYISFSQSMRKSLQVMTLLDRFAQMGKLGIGDRNA
jgi:hypothetical protein